MKKYLVTIKKIQMTKMIVSATSSNKAIEKVDELLTNSIENNVSLEKTFDKSPFFRYKAQLIKKH